MKKTRVMRILSLIAVVLFLAGCAKPQAQQPPAQESPAQEPEKTAEVLNFDIELLGGGQTSVASVRDGRPALIEFWGST